MRSPTARNIATVVLASAAAAALGVALVERTSQAQPASAAAVASAPRVAASGAAPRPAVVIVPGMPGVRDPRNLYADVAAGLLSPAARDALPRIYVPNLRSDDVSVVDPETMKVVDRFRVGRSPQHVVPSWDLQTLWVANNAEGRSDGSLTPIDPKTGKPGAGVDVDDPYNLYFTPDGKLAIVVAEARKRLDFRDAKTMKLEYSIATPKCAGINHADFSIDGRYAVFTCEFDGTLARIDLVSRSVDRYLRLPMPATRFKEGVQAVEPGASEVCTATKGMPQDIRISPDGSRFYVADMMADGVHVIDAASFTEVAFIPTGVGAHGLYPSRDGSKLYVANRGSHKIHGPRLGPGRVVVIDFATEKVTAVWPVPGGGSPDMGNVSADGRYLWLSGRYDDVVYRFDTSSGAVQQVKVGREPHGLTVWPQPGRYSLGHTGNLR